MRLLGPTFLPPVPAMPPKPAIVNEPVTLFLQDGARVVTFIDTTTKIHHVSCDLCGDDIALTASANPYRFDSHRTSCKKKRDKQLLVPFKLLTWIQNIINKLVLGSESEH
jgi:hypothetical protein